MNAEEMVLCKNARVRLTVDLSKVFYFRPDRGKSAAEIHLTPSANDDPHRLKIYDEREGSILVARKQANIRKAEKESKAFIDQTKIDTAKAEINEIWPERLNSNAAILLGFETIGKDQQMPILILRDAEEIEADGLLTATAFDKDEFSSFSTRAKYNPTHENWVRMIMVQNENEKTAHFLLVTVTNKEAPITIFYREIKDEKWLATDYKLDHEKNAWQYSGIVESKVHLEGEPAAEKMLPDPPAIIEVPIETPHKNGKVEAQCPDCDAAVVRINPKMLGKTKCKSCQTLLVAKT